MRVVRMDEVAKEPLISPLFTEPNVTRQGLLPESKDLSISIVNFGKGVRNKFHAHDSDQILIITAGTGIVAIEDEERVVTKGDIVLFLAGEKHWHGATPDSEFSHIFVTRSGSTTTKLED